VLNESLTERVPLPHVVGAEVVGAAGAAGAVVLRVAVVEGAGMRGSFEPRRLGMSDSR
jgi:hypothetical protein